MLYQCNLTTVDVCLNNPAEVVFARFLHCKLFFLLFSHGSLWKEYTIQSSFFEWEICSTSFRAKQLHKLFRVLLQEKFVYSLFQLFIQSFNIYYQCVLVVMCFIFLGYNPVLLCLLIKLGTEFIFQLLITPKTFLIIIS